MFNLIPQRREGPFSYTGRLSGSYNLIIYRKVFLFCVSHLRSQSRREGITFSSRDIRLRTSLHDTMYVEETNKLYW